MVNIKSLITQMNSQPTIQNLLASNLTLSIPREQAADITGYHFGKLIVEDSFSKLWMLHKSHSK
jgi:hypothetical protein